MDFGKGLGKHLNLKLSRQLVGACLLLSATLLAARLSEPRLPEFLVQPLDTISWSLAGFTGSPNPPLSGQILNKLLPDRYLSRTYRKEGMQADLFIAFYARQRAGESMHSPKHCLPGNGWEIWNYDSTIIPVDGRGIQVNNYSISHEGDRRLVLYWYQSKDRVISSEVMGKFLLARDALMQNSTASTIVRIIVPDRPGALADARAIATELIPSVERCFGTSHLL